MSQIFRFIIVKSKWVPPPSAVPDPIKRIIDLDLDYLHSRFKLTAPKSNLSRAETAALDLLRKDTRIVIKPADKGSAVVIQDRNNYIWEGERQLADGKCYRLIPTPMFMETAGMVKQVLQTLQEKKIINAKHKMYLLGEAEPRPRKFYTLPKIHKERQKWSVPFLIPPGRPIVSDCGSETYFTAAFLDSYLNPLSVKHSSYLKDTFHFIDKVKQIIVPPTAILFTMDVESLYTNIDIREGIQAIKNIFLKFPDPRRPDKELLTLLEINLTRNDFVFNEKWYLQIKGTAMGKKFAPAYANIFMAQWEELALSRCSRKPAQYLRFLDDIWGVWTHSGQDFELFVEELNAVNASIKVKAVSHPTSVDFLDTTTYKGPDFVKTNVLDTKVYFKETDTHALLFKTSYHPKHTFAGIVKSQLLRFHRIYSRTEDFRAAVKILFSALSTRGYGRSFLRKCFRSFQEVKPIQVSSLLPMITTYSVSSMNLIRHLKSNFYSVLQDESLLQDHRPLAALRRGRNLRDLLVRATVPSLDHPDHSATEGFYAHCA